MAYRLKPKAPLAETLRDTARGEVAAALASQEELPEEEAVHALRKHCKKMRALLRLVQRDSQALYRTENAHYRTLADTLAVSRDAVSLRDALAKLSPTDTFPHILAFLEARISRTDEGALQDTAELLRQGDTRVDSWPLEQLRWRSARKGYRRSYRRARKAMRRVLAAPGATSSGLESFHEYRKRVKDQWYHTRLLEGKYRSRLHSRRKPLKTLAQALGDWRDLKLLRRLLAHEGEPFHGELIPLLDATEARLDDLQRQIKHLSRELFAAKKFDFDGD